MSTVGDQYRQAGYAEQDALIGGTRVMGSRGARTVTAIVIALAVAGALLLIGEQINWYDPQSDVLIGIAAGVAWWFLASLTHSRR